MEPSRNSRLAPDERRDQLIRKGVELLGRRAYDQMSVTELARAAGTSKGLLYHYFQTKSDFVVAVLRQAREELDQQMTAADAAADPLGRLDANLDAFLAYVEEHAAGYQALARARYGDDDAIRAELAEGRRRRVAQLTAVAAALAESDRADVASPALETALEGWLSFSEAVIERWLSEHELRREQVRALLLHAMLAALAAAGRVDGSEAATRLADSALDALLRHHPESAAHERVDPAEVRVGPR